MTAQQAGAITAALAILAFYGVAFVLLLLGACHLWLDLRERLAERRRLRPVDWRRSFNHENANPPSGPPPLKLRHSGDLDAADVVRYLRCRDQRLQRALMDETNPPPEAR